MALVSAMRNRAAELPQRYATAGIERCESSPPKHAMPTSQQLAKLRKTTDGCVGVLGLSERHPKDGTELSDWIVATNLMLRRASLR